MQLMLWCSRWAWLSTEMSQPQCHSLAWSKCFTISTASRCRTECRQAGWSSSSRARATTFSAG
eukprot:scaffold8631_cov108-Isochrysis_galbana.AAC.1